MHQRKPNGGRLKSVHGECRTISVRRGTGRGGHHPSRVVRSDSDQAQQAASDSGFCASSRCAQIRSRTVIRRNGWGSSLRPQFVAHRPARSSSGADSRPEQPRKVTQRDRPWWEGYYSIADAGCRQHFRESLVVESTTRSPAASVGIAIQLLRAAVSLSRTAHGKTHQRGLVHTESRFDRASSADGNLPVRLVCGYVCESATTWGNVWPTPECAAVAIGPCSNLPSVAEGVFLSPRSVNHRIT